MCPVLRLSTIAAPLLLAGVAGAQTPGVWFTGHALNTDTGWVTSLTQDGSMAAGYCFGFQPYESAPGFRWTRQTGRIDFGLQPGMPIYTPAQAIDSLGTTIVGRMIDSAMGLPDYRAYRLVGGGLPQNLGMLPGETKSYAEGVSGDGTVVVGWAEHPVGPYTNAYGQAFRWTETGGMQGLGYTRPTGSLSKALAISRDGSTIIGTCQSDGPFGDVEAFTWRAGEGMRVLPGLPGAPYVWYEGHAVNADGTVVVGFGPNSSGEQRAIRWTSSGAQDLGIAPGTVDSGAMATSDDGNVIGGFTGFNGPDRAVVWTPATGMLLVADFAALHGVTIPSSYTLQQVRAISGDGLTFGGIALNLATNQREGFVLTVPAPATALVLLAPLLGTRRRRAR